MALHDRSVLFLAALSLGVAGGAAYARWAAAPDPAAQIGRRAAPTEVAPPVPRGPLAPEEARNVEVFERAAPGVVYVTPIALVRTGAFGRRVVEREAGTGSGFVWDGAGHVVTNFHVVAAASQRDSFEVVVDGATMRAELVGAAPEYDLAVLRMADPPADLVPIPAGSSADLRVGQTVYAIGNPFGLDHSMSRGIISALEREIESPVGRAIRGVIQTDAAINPGNSGGPLLDSAGRLIGINTAIVSTSSSSAGIGFAVPADTVRRVVPLLIASGRVTRPILGVEILSDADARQLGVEGVVVTRVSEGTGAARAGLRAARVDRDDVDLGDVIVGIDGQTVRDSVDMFAILERLQAGATARVRVRRGEREIELPVVLQDLD
jgi:S1-C subfamily serine protease